MSENTKEIAIMQAMSAVECYPIELETNAVQEYTKMPIGQLSAWGAVFATMAPALKTIVNSGAGETLYKMVLPKGLGVGEHLSVAKTGGLLGNVVGKGGKITQRARFFEVPSQPIPIDPATMLMAIAIASITKKLDKIEEAQKDIIEFLQAKERAEIKGNIAVLQEILNEYKYNCDNEKYKSHKHIQAQEIKRDAEQKIILFCEQISNQIKKKGFLHSDRDVKQKIQKVQKTFQDYELSLYMFSFSSFIEVMLLENFDEGYLNSVSNKIELYAEQYHKLHEECHQQIESEAKTSVESHVIRGVAGVNKVLGKAIAKIPKIRDGQIDESLIAAGEKVDNFNEKRSENTMERFSNNYANCVKPFVENIQSVNRIYNHPVDVLFDGENMYFKIAA